MGIVTLLSDFGGSDGYVGAMKGAILSVCPGAILVDLGHDIAMGDVRGGAVALARAAATFPPQTVHLAVVDPGVGGGRRGLALASGGSFFVGPDNGLLSLAAPRAAKIVVLDDEAFHLKPVSCTFHGRDVFAPVAGRLAAGTPIERLGSLAQSMQALAVAAAVCEGSMIRGEITGADHFGNLATNIASENLAGLSTVRVEVAGVGIDGLSRTYVDAAEGELLALVSSSGTLEIALRGGSARRRLGPGAAAGSAVLVTEGGRRRRPGAS
mgnify:CR=1 FL=1